MFLIAAIAIAITGCVSPQVVTPAALPQTNSVSGQITPGTPAQVVYVANPSIATVASNINTGFNTIAPVVGAVYPAAAPALSAANATAGGILALLTIVSTWYASRKNTAANVANQNAANHSAAAAALAATVVSSGNAPAALVNAAANGSSATVATHLAAAANPVQL